MKTLEFILVVPETVSCLPMFTEPPIPTPPETVKAPVVVEPDAVEDDIDITPPTVSTVSLALLDPSLT